MTSHLKSVKSLDMSGDQTVRVKHRSGEHMIQSYIVRRRIYGTWRAATESRLGQIQFRELTKLRIRTTEISTCNRFLRCNYYSFNFVELHLCMGHTCFCNFLISDKKFKISSTCMGPHLSFASALLLGLHSELFKW